MFVLMISIIISLIIVIFAVQNAAVVPVQFLIWTTDMPLVLVIFCSVFAGALLMFCLALWRELKHQIGKKPKTQLKTKKFEDKDPIDVSDTKQTVKENGTLIKPQTNEHKELEEK